ncbi:CAP domain-containing protein [Sordaria sp. MPI-SDFR-AT-0083]|nr:CAP domain-containing protein [Sordaria sp. MPI-SDFR-AT-0083]
MIHSSLLAITALFLSATSAVALPADVAVEKQDTHLFKRASPGPTDTTFINNVLTTVNPIRSKYKANALAWDATLAKFALTKSNGCKLNHTGPYGENAYWWWTIPTTFTPNFSSTVTKAFASWTSQTEITAYKNNDLLGGGHFTQTVWKASTRIGCAFSTNRCVQNPNQDWWFYCEFWPRGNLIGAYPGNVTVV